MQRTPKTRYGWVTLVVVAAVILVIIGTGSAQSASVNECETENCERDSIDESITRMLDRFGWETGSEGDKGMAADETVLTTETEDGEIDVTGDVSPGETVTITLTDGLADADVVVNGESAAPTDVNGNIEVIVPEDGEVTIVIETEQADHEINLDGSETDTEVSTSTSSESSTPRFGSSTVSTDSSTTANTSINTSNSVSSDSA